MLSLFKIDHLIKQIGANRLLYQFTLIFDQFEE